MRNGRPPHSEIRIPHSAFAPPRMKLEDWLKEVVARGGSDLYLVAGLPPPIRIAVVIYTLPRDPLRAEDIESCIALVLHNHALETYCAGAAADCSYRPAAVRFRINLPRERVQPAAALRVIPSRPPRFADLGLP